MFQNKKNVAFELIVTFATNFCPIECNMSGTTVTYPPKMET